MATSLSTEQVLMSILAQCELDIQSLHIICDDSLFKILLDYVKSYEILAPHFDIPQGQVYAIKSNTTHDYNLGKMQFLQLWKERRRHEATYLSLVQGFLDSGDRHCAECVVSHAKHLSLSRLPDQGSAFPEKTVPLWDDMSEQEKKAHREKLTVDIEKIKDEYATCLTQIAFSFQERCVSIEKVQMLLLSKLPAKPDPASDSELLSNKIEAATTLAKVFVVLARHTSWFNYQFLEFLVEKLANEAEKAMWLTYKNEVLKPYLMRSLFQVPRKSFSTAATSDAPAVYLCLKLVDNVNLSAKEALVIKDKLSELLEVPVLELSSFDVGSVILVYAVPKDIFNLYPQHSVLHQYIAYDEGTGFYHISANITTILLPNDEVEASIINKILHCRQAEKEAKDNEIERIGADNKALTYSNDALKLQLSILRKQKTVGERVIDDESKEKDKIRISQETKQWHRDTLHQLSILNDTLTTSLHNKPTTIPSLHAFQDTSGDSTINALTQNITLLLNRLQEKDELSKRLELERRMSLAKSHQIQKYERELKKFEERDHKVSLPTMLATYGLQQNRLQRECEDDLFLTVAKQMKYSQKLAYSLGIADKDITDLYRDQGSNDKMLSVLKLWKRSKGHEATYIALVQAFLDMNDGKTAEYIVRHAKENVPVATFNSTIIYDPPVDIKMDNFKQKRIGWHSPSFYTHDGGYCMCIKVDVGYTHIGVYAFLKAGANDDNLQWPFIGSVNISLLNQRGDHHHIDGTITFTHNDSDDSIGRVISGTVAKEGYGYATFISHADLQYNKQTDTEYLTNDTLHFRITQAASFSSCIVTKLPSWYRYISFSAFLAQFTMTDFSKHKAVRDKWYSTSFYTHKKGYKFCLVAWANGCKTGADTHVSLGIRMMESEYDNFLTFPFRGTFHIEVINWKEDNNHIKHAISITNDDYAAGGRVMFGLYAPSSKDNYTFLPHTSLYYNATTNTQYVDDNDCLMIRVANVDIHNS